MGGIKFNNEFGEYFWVLIYLFFWIFSKDIFFMRRGILIIFFRGLNWLLVLIL